MNRAIEWMARNPVASNILLIFILVGGALIAPTLKQEIFPDIEFDRVIISIGYPGAGPSEIESSLCLPLEEAVSEIEGIGQIICNARENNAAVNIDIKEGFELQSKVQDIKTAVERLDNLPEDITRPIVSTYLRRRQVVELVFYGSASEMTIFDEAEKIKDELGRIEGVSFVALSGNRSKEILIEITPENLGFYGLSLERLARIISDYSLDLPAGSIQTDSRQILLRTKSEKSFDREFERIPVITRPNGTVIYLKDIAKIKEGLVEASQFALFDGHPTVKIKVYQDDDVTPGEVSKLALDYVERKNIALPEGLNLTLWEDYSEIFESRFDLMIRNSILGLVLVLLSLTVFLDIRLAFWVMLGIPVSFLGSLLVLPLYDVSINMISMFAFILVLGIVVDDAIVIGENIFQKRESGMDFLPAAIEGCKELAAPVTFAILTTVVAFAPLLFIEGIMGKFMFSVPIIIISVLLISLIECLLILPSHLAYGSDRPLPNWLSFITRTRAATDKLLKWAIYKPFYGSLKLSLNYRYSTIALGVTSLLLCAGLVAGGMIPFRFFPNIEGDKVRVTVEFPSGFPARKSITIIDQIKDTGVELLKEMDKEAGSAVSSLRHIYTDVQAQSRRSPSSSTTAEITFLLLDDEKRKLSAMAFSKRWQKSILDFPEIRSLSFKSQGMHFAQDIQIALSHNDNTLLKKITGELKEVLAGYKGVKEIVDSEKEGNREFQFKLAQNASSLGITPSSFARNLRAAFSGLEALTIQKDREEIPVMVLYPADYRENLNKLETVLIQAPTGGKISLGEIAEIQETIEPVSIRRLDRKRVVEITASVEKTEGNLEVILADLNSGYLKQLKQRYPDLIVTQEGSSKERNKSLRGLILGFGVAILVIYALLAIFFKSYIQPLLVMVAIPFGMAGAVLGHLLLGYPISFLSLFGLVGLTGVVVNDSLILIDSVNRHPELKTNMLKALIEATQSRVRPIILTSLTTFVGLMPILLETSRQAKFLIPMAISLGVGIVFATFITLVLVPSFYLILEDFRKPRNQLP
ncbi:MAG: efflux RND transporter permease subunit [Deltaproteobacteria bacterium]|nr:efflux RND transporter permease subunit [Deltaproteobacteria bacterium]